MIIFGTRGVKSTMEQGEFLCPQCASNKNYKHKKVTRFFTLYFIPLIPLGRIGEFVECQTCRGTYVPRVLDYKPDQIGENEFQSVYEKAMRHSMVLMMLADGVIDDEEMKMVLQIINKFGHNDMTNAELEKFVEQVQKEKEPVEKYLKKITPSLNEHGKEIIIKCGLSVASADGNIDPSEIAMIHEMAKAMEMSSSHVKGIIHDMTHPEHAFSKN